MYLDCPVEKKPLKHAKKIVINKKTVITHICDSESNEEIHTKQFCDTITAMKRAEALGKQIKYKIGYSNFTFELWMILHKMECNGCCTHRKDYLKDINKAYTQKFEDLHQYKHEKNFKRILQDLGLEDVKRAIVRAKMIMKNNEELNRTLHEYKGHKYYKDNPSLTIWEPIQEIFSDCDLM